MKEIISIVTTLYNYRRYMDDLIKSVLSQTYSNWQFVIVDDGSTDEPLEVIGLYLKDHRIQYVRFDENRGYSFAKNEGIIRCVGDYIVMIDADDMLTPDSLMLRKNILDENRDKLWCHAKAWIYYPSHEKKEHPAGSDRRRLEYSKKMDLKKTYHHRLINPQTIMVRRFFHKLIGLYDESLRFSSDNEMFRRAIRFGHIPVFLRDFVALYRAHPDRMNISEYKRKRKIKVKKYIIDVVEKRFREGINEKNTRLWK